MLETLGISLVRIPLPFRLNHVNCFLAQGEDGWTIIDAGLHNSETVNIWNEQIGDKEIQKIMISHYHPDHYGYAGALQEKTSARLFMSETDAQLGRRAWQSDFIDEIRRNYSKVGIPNEIADKMKWNTSDFVPFVTPYPTVDHYLVEGERIQIGKYEYEVIFTPGHSDGLVCFYNKDQNVLLSTDHILPNITPNISYWFHGYENPLQVFFESLNKVKALNADYVIPSHGKPFYGANNRIKEIIDHHEERLEKTLDSIKGYTTVYEVCQHLFRKDLNIHETRFAIGETLAHLEYLRLKGECRKGVDNGLWLYSI